MRTKRRLGNTAEPDANFQEFYKWGVKNSIIIHCRTRGQLSEDGGISDSAFSFASSCSAEKCTNGCHLQVVTTWSEIFYGDLIKRSPSIKTLSVF